MDQNILTATTPSRVPPKLDTIPEDIVVNIVKVIRSWTDQSKSRYRKDVEKARLLRDSNLRSVVLTSRRARLLWQPFLLQDVTITVLHLPGFYHLIKRNNRYGKLVKSLHIAPPIQTFDQEKMTEIAFACAAISGLPSALGLEICSNYGSRKAIEFVYDQVCNLQVLTVEDPALGFDFIQGRKLAPQAFLSKSLRKLDIPASHSHQGEDLSLNANNAIWLLSFCPQLNQCSIAISVTHKDYKFVSELNSSFEGVSNVKHLALQFTFVFNASKRKTWWGLPEEQEQGYVGNCKKTETLYRFLKVTKKLLSLELASNRDKKNPGDDSEADISCLIGVESSFTTLEHLVIGPHRQEKLILSFFKKLRSLSVDAYPLSSFFYLEKVIMPKTLEVLRMHAYYVVDSKPVEDQFQEDSFLAELLESRSWPALREVVVFSEPINSLGELFTSPEQQKAWKSARQRLESSNVFKSGKVQLTCLKPSEGAGHYLTGEKTMSGVEWLCA